MVHAPAAPPRQARRGVRLVLAVQALSVVLVAGWFATGHASAPDAGLQQLDVLSLDERASRASPPSTAARRWSR